MSDKPARPLTPEEFALLSRRKDFRLQPVQRLAETESVLDGKVLRDVVMSTSAVDRARDTIDQRGWELKDYLANPVVLWCHDYGLPQIGQGGDPTVRTMEDGTQRLMAGSVEFTPRDVNPFGAMIGDLYLHPKRFARAFSVGLMPMEWNYDDERGGVNFKRQSLLELSACPIGMNQECLSGAKSAGISVDLFVPLAEKRLDGDAAAPAWMATDFAAVVYRSLTPRVHQVPGKKKDPERKRLMSAMDEQARQVAELAATVKALTAAVKAAPPAQHAPTPAAPPPPVKRGPTPEALANAVGQLLNTKVAALTGRVTED